MIGSAEFLIVEADKADIEAGKACERADAFRAAAKRSDADAEYFVKLAKDLREAAKFLKGDSE